MTDKYAETLIELSCDLSVGSLYILQTTTRFHTISLFKRACASRGEERVRYVGVGTGLLMLGYKTLLVISEQTVRMRFHLSDV